jgi:hypothetical protein
MLVLRLDLADNRTIQGIRAVRLYFADSVSGVEEDVIGGWCLFSSLAVAWAGRHSGGDRHLFVRSSVGVKCKVRDLCLQRH